MGCVHDMAWQGCRIAYLAGGNLVLVLLALLQDLQHQGVDLVGDLSLCPVKPEAERQSSVTWGVGCLQRL